VRQLRLIVALAAAVALAVPREAHACACCTNPGQRNVDVEALNQGKRALLEELRFADAAKLFLGEADPDSVNGIADPLAAYALAAAWVGGRLVFTLKNERGSANAADTTPRLRTDVAIIDFIIAKPFPKVGGGNRQGLA